MRAVIKFGSVALLLGTTALSAPAALAATDCASLANLALPETVITLAQPVTGGSFTPPGSTRAITGLPDFCRVAGSIRPTSDSDIEFEVWLPLANWNGKFNGVGNGGLAGTISYSAMAPALERGYATASTDTGHTNAGGPGFFALGHPEKIIDFGYRGHHELALKSKAIVAAFYGTAPAHNYYTGCSQGGQEGLMEAQRFPGDYDGLVAGDPDNFMTHHEVGGHLWITAALLSDPASYISASQAAIIGNAVDAACDAKDGVKDGVLNDPRTCNFPATQLACKPGQDPDTCLTSAQIQAVQKIWSGPDQVVGPGYDPGIMRGGETLGWPGFITGNAPGNGSHTSLGVPFFRYFIFDDPNWDFHSFDFKTDAPFVSNKVVVPGQTMSDVLDSASPDLEPLKEHGAKLIQYHGFADPDISPQNSINYFLSVVGAQAEIVGPRTALAETQDFYRLFMVPGMNHCGGGPGANTFDMLTALENWVEHGQAPERVIASHSTAGAIDFTRPLCSFPLVAQWTGTGSQTDAANYVCTSSGNVTIALDRGQGHN
jgi:feruloyl esterase